MSDTSYNNWSSANDTNLLKTIGKFVQHHRLRQNKSQNSISKASGISRSTLSLMERGEKTTLKSLLQVLRTLDLLYIMEIFEIHTEISPVEYAKLKKQPRLRANEPKASYNKIVKW